MRTQTPVEGRKTRATKENKQLIDIVKFNLCSKINRREFRPIFEQRDLILDETRYLIAEIGIKRERFPILETALRHRERNWFGLRRRRAKEICGSRWRLGRIWLHSPIAFEAHAVWALLDRSRETRPSTHVVKRKNAKIWLTKKEFFHRSAKIKGRSLTLIIRRPSLRRSQQKQDCTVTLWQMPLRRPDPFCLPSIACCGIRRSTR